MARKNGICVQYVVCSSNSSRCSAVRSCSSIARSHRESLYAVANVENSEFVQHDGAKSEYRLQDMINPGTPNFGLTQSCMFKSQSASDTGGQSQLKSVRAAHVSVPVVVDHLSLYNYFAHRCQSSFLASRFLLNDSVSSSIGLQITNNIVIEKSKMLNLHVTKMPLDTLLSVKNESSLIHGIRICHWGSDPATCVYRFKHNDLKSALFKGSNVLSKQQWSDSHPIVKNCHEIVTKSCDESRINRFSNKSREITKSIRVQLYAYFCPMLLFMSNSVRSNEFMANYKYRRNYSVKFTDLATVSIDSIDVSCCL